MIYFGVHGKLKGYLTGFFVVRAENTPEAKRKLKRKVRGKGSFEEYGLQVAWRGIKSAVDLIKKNRRSYYVSLGDGVYYFEI